MPAHRGRQKIVIRDHRAKIYQTNNNGDRNKSSNASVFVTQNSLALMARMDYSEAFGKHFPPRSSQTDVVYGTDDNGDKNVAVNGCVLSGDALPVGYQRVLESIASTRTEFHTRQTGRRNQVLNACHDQFMPNWANTHKEDWYFSTKSHGQGNTIWHNCNWSGPGLTPAPASGQTSDHTGTVLSWENGGGTTYVGGHQATAHAGASQQAYYGGGYSYSYTTPAYPQMSAGPPISSPYLGGYPGGNPGGYPPWYVGGSYGNGYR
ncbi:hypothetical protein Moror_2751 [Moniliophthora roreri MCA 2997]|uniref:Uncharacterized protein n=1 Tax=Moniliophthora roreri (strain MCA 2997) TaxID=1381753 RepID=V2YI80_MONRO|nr:hypothetical protein Moror_2751 [Moniliophthora roreri MCA 2997]